MSNQASFIDSVINYLPQDYRQATLLARVMGPKGPCICKLHDDELMDVTMQFPTVAHLLRTGQPSQALRSAAGLSLGSIEQIVANSDAAVRDPGKPYLLAPVDLQALKAAGVTFAKSMVERVVEEASQGDPKKAAGVRAELIAAIGTDLSAVVPGSTQAAELKQVLEAKGLWSQYLEVGLGPDAEIFTKAQPLSAVGFGEWVGLHPRSNWNNPEPEVVLLIAPNGEIVGATLGNDVNLRDFEGRSALLLSKAKDNNASTAIGPFIRLFDKTFDQLDLSNLDVTLTIDGSDGFHLQGTSAMREISRSPAELARQLCETHHYPDGAVLFTGTLFAPTQDRDVAHEGFTHKIGDLVTIATPRLGALINRVGLSNELPPWRWGAVELFSSLAQRGIDITSPSSGSS